MNYLSVCSGIEAASQAWRSWQPVAFAEIDAFPSALLAHYYPEVPNLGDVTQFKKWPAASVDVLVGGTPCQSFSIAGFRKGLADPRGNLALTYLAIAARYRPSWVLWENVPGVLSSHRGRDFAAFLGGLGQLGYGWAYRVLDAQFFRVAQRRRRVFVIGSARGWASAAAVLFERESLRWDSPPSRETREDVATSLAARTRGGGGLGTDAELDGALVARPLRAQASHAHRANSDNIIHCADIAPTLNAHFGDKMGLEDQHALNGAGLFVVMSSGQQNASVSDTIAPSLPSNNEPPLIAFANTAGDTSLGMSKPGAPPITTRHGDPGNVLLPSGVRRLTPRECERLQGFPDDYTLIPYRGKPAQDGPRYKALGNSMAVPVMRWLGERIAMVDELIEDVA